MNLISAAVRITRDSDETHCEAVLLSGLPRAVRHADEVCITEIVTAFTDIIRTSRTKSVLSSAESEENSSFAASGANTANASAQGSATASVIKMQFLHFAFACGISLSASGAICGTPAAAKP